MQPKTQGMTAALLLNFGFAEMVIYPTGTD
jgi:hypothetical protein